MPTAPYMRVSARAVADGNCAILTDHKVPTLQYDRQDLLLAGSPM